MTQRPLAGVVGWLDSLFVGERPQPIAMTVELAAHARQGNAFGLMSAGLDAAVVARFGTPLMQRVQDQIMNEYYGEQPLGTTFIAATGDSA